METKDFDLGFIACGPWLGYSFLKRLLVTLWWWPIIVSKVTFYTVFYWIKGEYIIPSVWGTLAALECFNHKWLWYEGRDSVLTRAQNGVKIDYRVDWSEQGAGWYPFW